MIIHFFVVFCHPLPSHGHYPKLHRVQFWARGQLDAMLTAGTITVPSLALQHRQCMRSTLTMGHTVTTCTLKTYWWAFHSRHFNYILDTNKFTNSLPSLESWLPAQRPSWHWRVACGQHIWGSGLKCLVCQTSCPQVLPGEPVHMWSVFILKVIDWTRS